MSTCFEGGFKRAPFQFPVSPWKASESGPAGQVGVAASFPAQVLLEASTVRENDSHLRTAHYTGGADGIGAKNTGQMALTTSQPLRICIMGGGDGGAVGSFWRQMSRSSLAIWERRSFVL